MTNAIAALIVATNLLQLSPMDVTISAPYYGVDVECYSLFIPTNAVTVTVLTNVVQESDESGCNMCYDKNGKWLGVYPAVIGPPCKPYHAATWRTETMIVVEYRVLRFRWLDVWREITSEKELSRTVKRFVKKEQWEEQP